MKTYVITGATGHTGKPIALGLLEQGQKVRIISRSADKAADLTARGAELFRGDTTDVELLKKALTGADALYAMIPFDAGAADYTESQKSHVRALAEAVRATGTPYVVTLSSVGAHLKEGAGVVQGLAYLEEQLDAIEGVNTMHLRATYFMENTLAQVGAIQYMGVMASPVKGDLKIPMVATRDIAAVALRRLLALDFSGKNHQYVLGPREVTYREVASTYGQVIGKPELAYHTATYEDGADAMLQMGLGVSVVDRMTEFIRSLNNGRVLEDAHRDADNTTPTDIEEFALVFKQVYEGR